MADYETQWHFAGLFENIRFALPNESDKEMQLSFSVLTFCRDKRRK